MILLMSNDFFLFLLPLFVICVFNVTFSFQTAIFVFLCTHMVTTHFLHIKHIE